MKHQSSCKITFILSFFYFFYSCKTGGKCEEPMTIYGSEVVVLFKDSATGRYLYSELSPLYNRDSLKVFDQDGNTMRVQSSLRSAPDSAMLGVYYLSFGNLYNPQTDMRSFSNEICKNYTIKYSDTESDSLQVCFKSKNFECGPLFEKIRVYHNGVLLDEKSNDAYAHITLLKN